METPSTYDGYLQVSDACPLNEMAANYIAMYLHRPPVIPRVYIACPSRGYKKLQASGVMFT